MARKLTNKQITDSIVDMARLYNKAASTNGLTQHTKEYLTARWALLKDIGYILASHNSDAMDRMKADAASWAKSADAVAGEAAK